MATGVKPHKCASKMRTHDYLYDSAFIVSGARDYARTAIRAAMASAQTIVQPLYSNMFSETKRRPRMQIVYHMNCRLPDHVDPSYDAYLDRVDDSKNMPPPDFNGKDRYKYIALPKTVMAVTSTTPDFHPPTPTSKPVVSKSKNRGTQSIYRESSAQTIPWQPDGKIAKDCDRIPEVLFLDKLEWGPGRPYRIGDLPADFHTTAIINKMRHARRWAELAEEGQFPRWMKKRDAIIEDVEVKDWIFREAEIDELQDIRLELLHRMQMEQRQKNTTKTSHRLAKLWAAKKEQMEKKIDHIRRARDREHRKLVALHEGGGAAGLVSRLRAARGHGSMILAATDPTSDLHAPLLRNGYQARRRHAEIVYDPSLLSAEDHRAISAPPPWLETCLDLTKACSGHHLPQEKMKLCERETKWSEQFLENLHNDLKKARLGAAVMSAGPLHVLKPRRVVITPRPATPVVESVDELEETEHQCALTLQRIIRGRAVQYLMYEGRTRAGELTEELKTTHGLQKEDKLRIAREEAKAREFNARRTEAELREDAITALADELCGGAVAAALDFLEKELRRLKEERRQHAFILIALREKTMREAAEAGRRQKEELRRKEHDEMFKHVLGTTQETVEAYLKQIVDEGVELAAEEEAVNMARTSADLIDKTNKENSSLSTAEESELVADLVQQFLLPHAHKTAARHKIEMQQKARINAAKQTIFGLLDEAEIKEEICVRCGRAPGGVCRCVTCPISMEPKETIHREDWRWHFTRVLEKPPPKSIDERLPMSHEARYLLHAVIDDAVRQSRYSHDVFCRMKHEIVSILSEKVNVKLDAKDMLDVAVDIATGARPEPGRPIDFHYTMKRVIPDAQERSEPFTEGICPTKLPSEIRRQEEEAAFLLDPTCYCVNQPPEDDQKKSVVTIDPGEFEADKHLLPSAVRILEDMKRCKCDYSPSISDQETIPDDAPDGGYTDFTNSDDDTDVDKA